MVNTIWLSCRYLQLFYHHNALDGHSVSTNMRGILSTLGAYRPVCVCMTLGKTLKVSVGSLWRCYRRKSGTRFLKILRRFECNLQKWRGNYILLIFNLKLSKSRDDVIFWTWDPLFRIPPHQLPLVPEKNFRKSIFLYLIVSSG